jgi:phosphoribosyl 1,2-cyclic phosphate phosphodiesterase
MTVEFKLLGTGAGPGVPSFYCDCVACREAQANPKVARTRSGALIKTGKEHILVDASPDLRAQLLRENIKTIDVVFISHWHYDHFGGLGDLEFYVKLSRIEPVKLFLPPSAVGDFRKAYPFLEEVFEVTTWRFGEVYQFGELRLIPLPANHSTETAGILLEAQKKVAYFTDTAGLPEATATALEGVDNFIGDATFYGENWYPQSHMSIEETIEVGRTLQAKTTLLTHLAMHYSTPVTVAELKDQYCSNEEVSIAYDGMVIRL